MFLFGPVGPMELIILVVFLTAIFYLLTLQKALSKCSQETRAMNPGFVWLLLIPIFNFIWQFLVVINIAKSFHNEFQKRGIPEKPYPGKKLGIAMSILGLLGAGIFSLGLLARNLHISSLIRYSGILAGIAGFVCWIIYWVRISGFSAKLGQAKFEPH